MLNRFCVLLVLLILQVSCPLVEGFQASRHNKFVEQQESLEDYRRRLGIQFNYNTTTLHPELCRHYNESHCQHLDEQARRLQLRTQPLGEQKAIVILLKVSNQFPTFPRSDYDLLFNDRGSSSEEITPTGSFYSYFKDNSQNQFIVDAYVHEWVEADGNEQSCAGSNNGIGESFHRCFIPALEELDVKHNDPNDSFHWADHDQNRDGYIDNLIILWNSYAAEVGNAPTAGPPPSQRIVSHSGFVSDGTWNSPTTGMQPAFYATGSAFRGDGSFGSDDIARWNIVAHEFIHVFGMFDLYDISYTGYGCGGYDIMAYTTGQRDRNKEPGNVGPYTKIFLGWLTPTEITSNGVYKINPSFTTSEVYKISEGYPEGEYLLIENRQDQLGWDLQFWGGGGIVIWSIDEDASQNDGTQTRVKVVQADGREDLENKVNLGDADDIWIQGREISNSGFPNTKSRRTGQSTGLRIYDISASQTEMEFTIGGLRQDGGGNPPETPAPVETPSPVDTSTPSPMDSSTPVPVDDSTSSPVDTSTPAPVFDNNPSTPAPVITSPAPTEQCNPGDTDCCLIAIDTEECLPLLAATTPRPGCDCYNYCGNAYQGCCAFGEDCPIQCNGGSAAIAGCVFPLPTESPTQFPTAEPSTSSPTVTPSTAVPISDPPTIDFSDRCQITVNTDRCSNFIPAQQPMEGCDCYNYCGRVPLECCKLGEKCPPLDCDSSSEFVAGCQLDDTPSSSPSSPPSQVRLECPVAVSTEKCPDLMPTITPIEPCDCYNFCSGEEIECCPFESGCPLACTGDLVAGCQEDDDQTLPPDPDVCLTSDNTELCLIFTVGQTPEEDCDCYNYCGGQFVGCCGFGEECDYECPGLKTAGCSLERPRCLVSINTEKCEPLVENQTPEEGCDCYNYCDGEYKGCCPYDTFCGSLGCGSVNSDRIAAGCTLDGDGATPTQAPVPAPGPETTSMPVHFWPDGFTAPRKGNA